MKQPQHPREQGFTLLEVLIALGIVAVISLLSWRGLDEVLRMSTRLQSVDEDLQVLAATFNQLEKDLRSVELGSPRPSGRLDEASLGPEGLSLLGTVRQGSDTSYNLQVFWTWQNGQLKRATQLLAEGAPRLESESIRVPALAIRLWTEGLGWGPAQQYGDVKGEFLNPPVLAGRPNPLTATQTQKPPGTDGQGEAGGGAKAQASPDTASAGTSSGSGDTRGEGEKAGTGGGGSTAASDSGSAQLVRLVQVLVVLPNGQAVNRVFELGGVY